MTIRTALTILKTVKIASTVALPPASVWAYEKSKAAIEEARKDPEFEETKLNLIKVGGVYYILPVGLLALNAAADVTTDKIYDITCSFNFDASELYRGSSILRNVTNRQNNLALAGATGAAGYLKLKNDANDFRYSRLDPAFRKETDGELYYDEFSGRFFRATGPQIAKALLEFANMYSVNGGVCMNDLYDAIGSEDLPMTVDGATYGYDYELDWSEDEDDDVIFDQTVIPIEIIDNRVEGTTYHTIRYYKPPMLLRSDDVVYNYSAMKKKQQ